MADEASSTTPTPPRTIVIGAGVSGLACARELKQRRHDVLVLEARHRVGGRLKGIDLGNSKVDLGGALIHGIHENPIYQMVQHMGIPTKPVSGCLLLDQRGWPVDTSVDQQVSTTFNQVLEKTFARARGSNGKFGDLFQAQAKEELSKMSMEEQNLFEWHKANLEVSCGASFGKLGYKWNDDEQYGYDGDHVAVESSWATVMDTLKEGLNIRYGAQVRKIQIVTLHAKQPSRIARNETAAVSPASRSQSSSSSVRRSSRSNKGIPGSRFSNSHETIKPPKTVVHVTLSNGTILQADSVVCTLPLGVLKLSPQEGGVTFDPPLPLVKQDAISKLGCGLLNKCALSFPHVFWQDDDFIGVVSSKQFHLMVNHNRPHPVLVFWFGGDFALEIQDWTDDEIVDDCLNVLRQATGKTPPEPLDFCVTRWGHEEYSRGAFVYVPPGVDSSSLAVLSEPVCVEEKPVILFCGEHTTPYHPSTIHGAYLSGIREAYRLDLTLAPALNNYLDFNEQSIYKRTFSVASKSKDKSAAASGTSRNAVVASSLKKHQKKKRSSGDMTLRKRPRATNYFQSPTKTNGIVHPSATATVTTNGVHTAVSPSRKSHRSTAGKRLHDFFEPTITSPKTLQEQRQQNDKTLVRAVESYGKTPQAWSLIHSKVLPEMTIAQLKARHQKVAMIPRHADQADWTSWVVPKEKTIVPSIRKQDKNRRSSLRKSVRRVMLDM